ncbi:hypothetical protein ACS0TY_022089 [Phlomoides rotata]
MAKNSMETEIWSTFIRGIESEEDRVAEARDLRNKKSNEPQRVMKQRKDIHTKANCTWNLASCICVIGDLNSISRESEREDRGLTSNHREIVAFQSFINDNGLVDLPLHGRRFSWYKSNGSCKSRIDRALLNSHWIHRWPNSGLRGLRRSISDHCPIMLEINSKDWGSKQFLYLNAWEEIRNLNTIDEVFGLQEHEIIKINESLALLLRELNMKSTLNYQKARCSWIKEGDCNSRFFHNYINMKRRRNNILGLQVNGEWVEEVLEVKKGVFDHFHSHFKRDSCVRPLLASDFTDKKLS